MLNFEHRLPNAKLVYQRHPFLVNNCRGKKVLHIGCVDVGLMHERFATGQLLHQKLDEVSTVLWGIDIDEEGIDFLKSKDFDNVHTLDITEKRYLDMLIEQEFEVIIFSEVIEHLLNPGDMLDSIRTIMTAETRLLITAPNAYGVMPLLSMMKGIEFVHPDHNYYFSHVTLRNLVTKSDLLIEDEALYTFLGANFLPKKVRSKLIKFDSDTQQDVKNVGVTKKRKRKKLTFRGLYWLLLERLKIFITRRFIKFLFKRTVFWGDGIVLICRRN